MYRIKFIVILKTEFQSNKMYKNGNGYILYKNNIFDFTNVNAYFYYKNTSPKYHIFKIYIIFTEMLKKKFDKAARYPNKTIPLMFVGKNLIYQS